MLTNIIYWSHFATTDMLLLFYILLLALHLGSHTPSWEDLRVSSFLEGGCCWARCWSWRWLKLYSPQVTVQRETNFLFNLCILVGVSVLWSNFICSFAACLGDWCSTRIPVSDVGCLSGCAQRCSDDLIIHATRTAAFFCFVLKLKRLSCKHGWIISQHNKYH